ncbi:proteoglycan 4-like [Bufo gargarizans]|uniref:proteoglycan 4-like n=1 Tax=Bufo gargarizans TaxID=30331 RepID=UPI001CF51DDD|nr:proteoglycan 4-like [Bufo gargarizans]
MSERLCPGVPVPTIKRRGPRKKQKNKPLNVVVMEVSTTDEEDSQEQAGPSEDVAAPPPPDGNMMAPMKAHEPGPSHELQDEVTDTPDVGEEVEVEDAGPSQPPQEPPTTPHDVNQEDVVTNPCQEVLLFLKIKNGTYSAGTECRHAPNAEADVQV